MAEPSPRSTMKSSAEPARLLVPSLSPVALAVAVALLAFWKALISLYGPLTHQGSSW